MFLHKILLMCILIHGSRCGPTFFKFFRPIKIEDSEIPASSVANPETNQKREELLETEEESSLFLKPNLIDSSNKEVPLLETEYSSFLKPIRIDSSKKQAPMQTATEASSFLKPIRIGTSKKQGSFQVPVINKLVQEKFKGGTGRQTERPTSLLKETGPFLPQESESSPIPQFPQVPLRTATEFSSFFKPIRIDSSKKQVSLQTATEPISLLTPIRIGTSKKQGSFQVPVINRLVQEKIFGGPKLQTKQPTSPPQESVPFLPRETDSSIPSLPQVPLRTEFSSFFKPIKIGSSKKQAPSHTLTDAAPGSFVKPIPIPIVSSEKRVSETNSFLAQKSSTSPQESNLFLPLGASSFVPQKLPFLVKSTTNPAPETSKAIVQGFRVIGDPSNTVVFLDLQALKASGIDISSSTIHIGSNSLEIIDGLQTEAPTNEKLTLPASAPSNKRLAIPAPSFVTKATKQSLPSSETLKPSRLPESIKKFSVSLKSDKAPVFFSRKVSTSPSLSVQDFSNFPVESVSSPSLGTPGFSNFPVESASSSSFSGTRGFSNFAVESVSSSSLGTSSRGSQDFSNFPVKSVFQAVPKAPLRHHASSIVDDDGLSGGLSLGGQPVALADASLAHVSQLLVDGDPLVQLENLKKIKVPGSFITSSVSPSEGSQLSFSTGQESLQGANNRLSLQEKHHQQHQLQQVHRLESLLWDHDEHSSQQHHPEHHLQLQQVEEQQQDNLHGDYREISPVEETTSNAQQSIPLQQHRQHLQQHQQQLQHVRQQEQQSIHREHAELASEEESPLGIHRVLPSRQQQAHHIQQQLLQQDFQEQQDSAHGEHPFSSGPETLNEEHHPLPFQQQQQHQQQLHLHQQQLQEHQQQVEELKQQLQQLEQQRQHQLHQLEQQQESIHRFSLPQKEEDSRKSTYQQDLEDAFQFLG